MKKTVHLIAAHEMRMNFPLTRVRGNNVEEWIFPGVHSDIGGGYAPADQGRSRWGHASLASQIPLVHMYRSALVHGVPFVRFDKLKNVVRDDFEVSDVLHREFNIYVQRLRAGTEMDFRKVYCKHMRLYYQRRSRMLYAAQGAISRNATTAQDRQDLEEASANLQWDLRVMQSRANPNAFIYDHKVALSPQERAGASQMQVVYADSGYPLTPWERWALGIFEAPFEKRRDTDANEDAFFQNFVHDSLAGFYLAGAVTQFDKQEEFKAMCKAKADGERLNEFQQRIYNQNKAAADTRIRAIQSGIEPPDDKALKLEYPLMRDDDAPRMRVAVIRLATSSRREGGGYFRQRWVYMPEAGDAENETEGLRPGNTDQRAGWTGRP
ncbi:hypothetical protein CF68_26010 [Cupriavidus sp. SK-4]|uniref:phospholipase effector Tle1 domain-containing protein n=1 Tax=Cupriavidus sp. SK-4 TaxID=574750 RepID=UPI000450DD24|nr:DUF2235 domain-containing protein [Cupriavidus sp. SK-4]EYS93811.1 hypothetical protein CF68_26010 [Cupriavidus sp. SK-4]